MFRSAPVIVRNTATGGSIGALSDAVNQGTDLILGKQSYFELDSLLVNATIGGTVGGALGGSKFDLRIKGLNAGRNNSVAIYKGLRTRFENGSITQFQRQYPFAAGVGTGLVSTPRTAVATTASGAVEDNKGK